MESRIAVFSGIITGSAVYKLMSAGLFTAIAVAFATGMAAHYGKKAAEWIDKKFTKKK